MRTKLKTVIQIAGMKNWNWLQSKVLPNMVKALEAMNITTHCEVCVGGLGLQPIRLLEHPKNVVWVINDKDSDKVNLYKVIRDYPLKLEYACDDILTIVQSMISSDMVHENNRYLDVQEIILQQIKSELQTKGFTKEVTDAAVTILQNCHSERATTYTVKDQRDAFRKKSCKYLPNELLVS